MWRRAVIFVLFLIHKVSLQPVTTDIVESIRQARQLDFGECCPCPDKNVESNFRNQGHWFAPTSTNARNLIAPSGNENAGQFYNTNGLGSSSQPGFDDCPCRFRSTDSDGSSSIFFPSAMHPNGPLSKPLNSKEDPKNLLEPEVGLASSVLETLRKATDEEYRDALARDAAKAKAAEDATPEESGQNIVTIILPSRGDDEDILTETSHIHEPRCIDPLVSSLNRMKTTDVKSPNLLSDIFRLPKSKPLDILHRNGLDMDNNIGGSDIQECIVDASDINPKLKTNSVLLRSDNIDVCKADFRSGSSLKFVPSLDIENESEQTDVLQSSKNPSIPLDMRGEEECNTFNTDMKSAASDIKELFANNQKLGLKLGSLTSENSPLNLKNLLKLRDVELVPPSQLIDKLKLVQPTLQLPPLIENMPKLSDLLKNGIRFDFNKNGKWNSAKVDGYSIEDGESKTNIQVIPRDKTLSTDILDTLPSTSNINEIKENCDIKQEADKTRHNPVSETKAMKTEIIDSIPNLFHTTKDMNHDDTDNEPGQELTSGTGTCDLTHNSNGDMTAKEIISSQSDDDVSELNNESQESMLHKVQSQETDQDVGARNCLETIHVNQISLENNGDISPNSHMEIQNSVDEEPQLTQEVQARNTPANNEKYNKLLSNHNEIPLSKSLTSIKESILRKIDDRKRTSKLNKGDKLRESNDRTNIEDSNTENLELDCHHEPSQNVLSVLSNTLKSNDNMKKSADSGNVQFEDLQNLSNSLLKKSLSKDESALVIENDECDDDANADMKVSGIADRAAKPLLNNSDVTIDSDTASTNQFGVEVKNPSSSDMALLNNRNLSDGNMRDEETACINSSGVEDSAKFLRSGPDVNEMTAEGSEPEIGVLWHDPLPLIKDTRLGSPLSQNNIVQPSSLFDGIRNAPSLDLGSALNLPTLDDIRERLTNVFGTYNKNSVDENIDCPNVNPIMSSEPSTSNFMSKSPIMPLEDLNLDIFQLKPLTAGKSSKLSKTPGLNLNSFRTKVPVPNNLDLKPLRLQSTMGNEGGLLGDTFSLGRNAGATSKLSETLGNPLQNIASLDEMMFRMKENVENLVNSPLNLNKNMDSIPKILDFSNSLRTDAENTIRALQSRMGSTLRQSNLLSNTPKKPNELIERIADAKEDFDAKLNGLHYDFNDRLASIHENILDQTGLTPLNPLFQRSTLSRNNNQNTAFKRLHTPASKRLKIKSIKENLGKTANFKNRPTDRKANSDYSLKKFKMPAAASVPISKTIEAPKFKLTLDKSLSNSKNDPKLRLISTKTNPLRLENKLDGNSPKQSSIFFQEKSVLGKHAGSFKENKVKVAFGSTTPTPISTLRSQQRISSNFDGRTSEDLKRTGSGLGRIHGLKLKSSSEPDGSPSEMQPTRFRSLMTTESRNCNDESNPFEESMEQASLKQNLKSIMRGGSEKKTNLNSKTPIVSNTLGSGTESSLINRSPTLPLPSWPKEADNSFLSKVRDALKARLSSFDPTKAIDGKPKPCPDMERSASENFDVVVRENLKENVAYKCSMVCSTKEP